MTISTIVYTQKAYDDKTTAAEFISKNNWHYKNTSIKHGFFGNSTSIKCQHEGIFKFVFKSGETLQFTVKNGPKNDKCERTQAIYCKKKGDKKKWKCSPVTSMDELYYGKDYENSAVMSGFEPWKASWNKKAIR